jgi:hypothetical protein
MLNLLPATQTILKTIEEKTGKSVQLMQDDSLPILATIQTARNGAGFHILRYKPTNEPLDYLVAYQAGFILRLYENEPDKRFDFATLEITTKKVKYLLSAQNANADDELVNSFAEHLTKWLLMNLRSFPVGMRVDQWIRRSFPQLHEQQDRSIAIQQQQNVSSLSMNLQGLTVPDVLLSPNTAYAIFCDDLTGQNTYSIPYEASGLLERGETLMNIWREIPESPESDCTLIDAWAEAIGFRDLYVWKRFTP